jgi:hypothetical protein
VSRLIALALILLLPLAAARGAELPPPVVGPGADRWGGHTVERHVGKSDAELRQRLARDPRLAVASAWDDLAAARATIDRALSEHAGELLRWLGHAPAGARRTIDYRGATPIGRAVRAEAPARVVRLSNARLVIESLGNGRWRLITAYPSF